MNKTINLVKASWQMRQHIDHLKASSSKPGAKEVAERYSHLIHMLEKQQSYDLSTVKIQLKRDKAAQYKDIETRQLLLAVEQFLTTIENIK